MEPWRSEFSENQETPRSCINSSLQQAFLTGTTGGDLWVDNSLRGAVHTLSSRPLETPHPLFPPSLRSADIPLRQSELPGGTEGRQSDCFDKDDTKKELAGP